MLKLLAARNTVFLQKCIRGSVHKVEFHFTHKIYFSVWKISDTDLLNVFQNFKANFFDNQLLKDNIPQIKTQIDLEEFFGKS